MFLEHLGKNIQFILPVKEAVHMYIVHCTCSTCCGDEISRQPVHDRYEAPQKSELLLVTLR